ncbi:MAG: ABC transporter permease, partial [Acidimicrobiia bacterium]
MPAETAPRHPLLGYAARRLAGGLAALFAVSVLVFAGTEVLPGDAATVMLGKSAAGGAATPEQVETLRQRLGLDRPAPQRYLEWVGGMIRGDLGTSLYSREPVSAIIGRRFPNTLVLAALAAALLIPTAIGFGLWAGARAGRAPDRIISMVSVAVQSLPEFVMGTFLIAVAAVALRLVPPVSL